jgi:ankyrin repeat protein
MCKDPVCVAIIRGDIKKVIKLLGDKLELDLHYDLDKPLHIAARKGSLELAEALISAGANIDSRDRYETTPLYHAVYRNDIAMVKFLISKGADVNVESKIGTTPLLQALSQQTFEITEILLENGARTNVFDRNNNNPMRIVSELKNLELFKLLHNYRMRVDIDTLYRCIAINADNITEYIIDHVDIFHCVLTDEIDNSVIKQCIIFKKPNIAIKIINKYLWNLLNIDHLYNFYNLAIVKDCADLVGYLIDCGVSANSTQVVNVLHGPYSPLFLAYYFRCQNVFKVLISKGANTKERLNDGGTYLHRIYDTDTVVLLLKSGLNPFVRDNNNFTALCTFQVKAIFNAGHNDYDMFICTVKVLSVYMNMLKLLQASKGIFKFEPSLQREIATNYLLNSG